MARWRFFGSALLIVAMFVASATPASAAIQVRLVVGGPYTFSRGQALAVAFVDCTDSETGLGSAVSRDTDDDVESRQSRRHEDHRVPVLGRR